MIIELVKKICSKLDAHNIPYMVSGSIALNIYSIPRMTRDIDIVLELHESRLEEFTSLFPKSYLNKNTIKEEIEREGMFNIIDHETGFKIDFILKKSSEYYNIAFDRRRNIKEFDIYLWVISPEDLIIAKIIWIQQYQSDQQMIDIKNLFRYPELDKTYILNWIKKLNLKTFNLLEYE